MTQLYEVKQAANILGVHPQQVYELVWANQITYVDVSVPTARVPHPRPRIRISHAELERFIKSRTRVKQVA